MAKKPAKENAVHPLDEQAKQLLEKAVKEGKIDQKDILKEPGLLIWEQRISFYNENNKLVKLSLNSAEKIFGKSKKIDEANSVFYTFEVGNVPVKNVEQHIYKIDLKFDDKGIIQSYRVSGPRISNPTWISN